MKVDPTILAARAEAVVARARLDVSVHQAKARLSPRSLAATAVENARDRATEAAQTGLQAVRDRPAATAAVVGALGVALARKPILRWVGSLFGRRDATADDTKS